GAMRGAPPERAGRFDSRKECRSLRPGIAAFHHDCRAIVEQSHRRTQLIGVWKERTRLHHVAPNIDDTLIGDRAVRELENADRVVERMQADHPIVARSGAPPHGEGQLAAVAPLLLAVHDLRRIHGAFADPGQRVADDRAFGVDLSIVAHVLKLTTAAPIDAIVIAERFDPVARRHEQVGEPAAREPFARVECYADAIAWGRSRYEHDDAVRSRDTIPAGRDAVDHELGVAHRSASCRAARSQPSWLLIAPAPAGGASAVGVPAAARRGAWRSRSAINAATSAAVRVNSAGGRDRTSDSSRRSSH